MMSKEAITIETSNFYMKVSQNMNGKSKKNKKMSIKEGEVELIGSKKQTS
jgi:hypothetical protein